MSRRLHLLFDLDGTLVDTAPSIAEALSVLRRRRGGDDVDAVIVRPLASQGAMVLVPRALGDWAGDPAIDLAEFRAVVAQTPTPGTAIYPGAVGALQELRDQRHAMSVVTNKPEGLARQLLTELDLMKFFATVIGGDTVAQRKPDADPLRAALSATDGVPAQALMIGDSAIDAGAAAALGVPFLLFTGGYENTAAVRASAHAMFDAFARLPDVIERLSQLDG